MINMREPTQCVFIPIEIFTRVHPLNTQCLTQRTEPSLINLPNLTLTSKSTYTGTQAIQCTLSELAALLSILSPSPSLIHTHKFKSPFSLARVSPMNHEIQMDSSHTSFLGCTKPQVGYKLRGGNKKENRIIKNYTLLESRMILRYYL